MQDEDIKFSNSTTEDVIVVCCFGFDLYCFWDEEIRWREDWLEMTNGDSSGSNFAVDVRMISRVNNDRQSRI